MPSDEEFTTESARAAAAADRLGEWVSDFLCSPGSDNAALAGLLSDPPRWWIGPVQVALDDLHRLAGPAGAPVLEEVDDDEWRDDVDDLSERIEAGHEPPPVIASFRDDQLVLEDGNHRVEALRRSGAEQAWTIIGFDSAIARDRYLARGVSA
jgi:hypothetical protein